MKEDNMKPLKPFKLWCIQNFPFIADDFDQMTYYELLCKIVEYLNKTIDSQNKVIDNMNYVLNYFNNLDVQEEINNKLDEMVETGVLQEIITDYLNSKAIFGFDTVASMKSATNLINGSYSRTYGYYYKNDGGGALYKIRTITNDDIVDNSFIISMTNDNTLVAELITDSNTNLLQLGAKGDETTDNTSIMQNAINKLSSLVIPAGIFVIDTITINKTFELKGLSDVSVLLKKDSINPNMIIIEDAQYVSLHDFKIQGDQASENDNNGIYISTRSSWGGRHLIENICIFYFNGYGIFIGERNQGINILNCRIHYTAKDGIYGSNCADNKISECFISYSKRYGLYYNGSNSIISNLRLNDCNREDLENYGGIYIWKQNILQNIMLQQNKVKDIVIDGDENIIDFISNMTHSESHICSIVEINGNYNSVKMNVLNGLTSHYANYLIKYINDNILGNNFDVNYNNNDHATPDTSMNKMNIVNKYVHPSNIVNFMNKNYNRYINVASDTLKKFNSVNLSPIDIQADDFDEFTYDTGITDISSSQNIILQQNISGLYENNKKLYVSYDYNSNLPINSSYSYQCFLINASGSKQEPVTIDYKRAKGHMNAIFDIDTSNFEPINLRMVIHKHNNEYTNNTNIIYKLSNLIISKEVN